MFTSCFEFQLCLELTFKLKKMAFAAGERVWGPLESDTVGGGRKYHEYPSTTFVSLLEAFVGRI